MERSPSQSAPDAHEKLDDGAPDEAWFPEGYGQETADAICDRLVSGESLRAICDDDAMPCRVTVCKWLAKNAAFANQYACARELQADALFDEILVIADDGSNDWMEKRDAEDANIGWRENGEAMQRSRLRVDARKWMAGKLRPKVYGDKLEVEQHTTIALDLNNVDVARRKIENYRARLEDMREQ